MSKSLISINIRTKNEEKWIASCLRSIFDQKYKKFEIIIVDNHSTDNTIKIINKFNIKKNYKNKELSSRKSLK